MSPRDDPTPLGEVLSRLAGRWRRVDLRVIDEVRRRWPEVVGEALAARCRPEFIKDGVLIVSVPSGAHAERLHHESTAILSAFGDLGSSAPRQLRAVLERP